PVKLGAVGALHRLGCRSRRVSHAREFSQAPWPAHTLLRVSDILTAAKQLAPTVRAEADRAERERRLSAEVVRGLIEARVPNMLVPKAVGGGEVDPATFLGVTEELALADGAAAWCAMIAATSGLPAAYLDAY